MPVMARRIDEKAYNAAKALREIERFMATSDNGLTPAQREGLTQKKLRLQAALQRYNAAGG
jgi:hypothetical protein